MATVMVVDDMESSRLIVSRLLKAEGYTPVCAANGAEALAILPHIRPAVVLLDVMMPVMDGISFLEVIRRDPQWQALPVILLSARSDAETIARAQELGAKEYLVKSSFSIQEIMGHVHRYTQQH